MLRTFFSESRGNVAMFFAVSALPIVMGVGFVIDYAKAISLRGELQNAVDSVALAVAPLAPADRPVAAEKALAARLGGVDIAVKTSHWISTPDGAVTGFLAAASETAFLKMVSVPMIRIFVTATAKGPAPQPSSTTFDSARAGGWYWKNVSVWIRPPGSTTDKMVASYIYQPVYFDQYGDTGGSGKGAVTSNPAGTITLPPYERLYLRMSVRGNGCPPDHDSQPGTGRNGRPLECVYKPGAKTPHDMELRTDDPITSHHLFVDGVQLKKGAAAPLADFLKCGQTVKHAWEDGGNFSVQDYHFSVTTACSTPSWANTSRLTR